MMNYPGEDQMYMSEFYGEMYTQPAPQQGPAKPKRRRKKNKGENSETVFRKRKLTDEQVNLLELNFGNEHKLESERKDRIASELGLDPRQVPVWFQNRRARWKTKTMEEAYAKLKAEHDNTVVEKCRLETEVVKLKEQLTDKEKEMQKLSEGYDRLSSTSPCSSFSMEAMAQPYLGDFKMEEIGNIFYVPDNYNSQGFDWPNFYI